MGGWGPRPWKGQDQVLTIKPCPRRCGAQLLTGLSGGRACSVDVALDTEPLDPLTELTAVVAGCWTWTLHPPGDAYPRSAAAIAAHPAGTVGRQTVHADHRCPLEPRR